MAKYLGTGRTSWFNDRQVRAREYKDWHQAGRHFEQSPKDRQKVAELTEAIAREGLREPIVLGVSDRYPDVYIGDGHHRAIALMNLGIPVFRFHWYWIRSFGVRMESEPFPYHLLDGGR